jgi:hypothetical protein
VVCAKQKKEVVDTRNYIDRLESSLRAVSTKRVASAQNVFIVSPFNAGRDGDAAPSSPLLVAGAPLAVRVWLSNPLAVALEIDR